MWITFNRFLSLKHHYQNFILASLTESSLKAFFIIQVAATDNVHISKKILMHICFDRLQSDSKATQLVPWYIQSGWIVSEQTMYKYNNIDFYLTFIQFLIFVGLYSKAVYKVLILKDNLLNRLSQKLGLSIFFSPPPSGQKVCNHLERFMMIIQKININTNENLPIKHYWHSFSKSCCLIMNI